MEYGITKTTSLSVDDAETFMRESLGEQGFGVLTYIDVAKTLKDKLDVERTDYRILGACNPRLADRALTAEEGVGLLLPCNVIVYEGAESTTVSALNPEVMSSVTGHSRLDDIADEARGLLEKALSSLPE